MVAVSKHGQLETRTLSVSSLFDDAHTLLARLPRIIVDGDRFVSRTAGECSKWPGQWGTAA